MSDNSNTTPQKDDERKDFTNSPYEWHLQVWEEFYSSGIWLLWDKEKQKKTFANISDYSYLGLPDSLVREFKFWQEIYDEYGIYWGGKNATIMQKEMEKACNITRVELAKKLKAFLRDKAYVETYTEFGLKEIKFYYVSWDYTAYLWDEEGCAILCEDIGDDIGLNLNTPQMQKVEEKLDMWSNSYSVYDDKWNYIGISDEIHKKGKELTKELKALLPSYVCLEYWE